MSAERFQYPEGMNEDKVVDPSAEIRDDRRKMRMLDHVEVWFLTLIHPSGEHHVLISFDKETALHPPYRDQGYLSRK